MTTTDQRQGVTTHVEASSARVTVRRPEPEPVVDAGPSARIEHEGEARGRGRTGLDMNQGCEVRDDAGRAGAQDAEDGPGQT